MIHDSSIRFSIANRIRSTEKPLQVILAGKNLEVMHGEEYGPVVTGIEEEEQLSLHPADCELPLLLEWSENRKFVLIANGWEERKAGSCTSFRYHGGPVAHRIDCLCQPEEDGTIRIEFAASNSG